MSKFFRRNKIRTFKLLEGKNGPTTFLVLNANISGQPDLSTTYLGGIQIITSSKIKAEERFPISEQGYTVGKLLDGTECQILLDTGASKSFMSKSHYLHCK